MSNLDKIEWHGPVETWRFPLTPEQIRRLGSNPAYTELVQIMAVAPSDAGSDPNLILSFPCSEGDLQDQLTGGDPDESPEFLIRFGQMPTEVFLNLPEHDGW